MCNNTLCRIHAPPNPLVGGSKHSHSSNKEEDSQSGREQTASYNSIVQRRISTTLVSTLVARTLAGSGMS